MENGVAALILGKPEEKEEKSGSVGEEYETVAAEIILGASERKPELLAKGLKAFIHMCLADEGKDDSY